MGAEYALVEAIAAWRAEIGAFAGMLRAVADSSLLKGAVLFALALAAAAKRDGSPFSLKGEFPLRFAAVAVSAIAVARLLQEALPHRDRPIVDFSTWAAGSAFGSENSFPSDHAAYMTAMATAIFFADRKLGILALVWTGAIVLCPRVLLGYHYPTDIVAGAAIGAAIAFVIMKAPAPSIVLERFEAAESTAPQIVYPIAFLFAFELASNFNSARALASALLKLF